MTYIITKVYITLYYIMAQLMAKNQVFGPLDIFGCNIELNKDIQAYIKNTSIHFIYYIQYQTYIVLLVTVFPQMNKWTKMVSN